MKYTVEQIVALQAELKTDQKIAERLGVTRQAVHLIRKKLGIIKVDKTARNEQIKKMLAIKVPVAEIAKETGMTRASIYRIIKA